MNKFYGVGVGPGEPELITLKALKVLQNAGTIFVPKAKIKGDSIARKIVERLLGEENEIIELEFPMTRNERDLHERYHKSAGLIFQKIREGNDVAYLTLGDPLLYSTYIYLLDALREVAPELTIETIPGITAYSAVAAKFSHSLAEKDERVCICTVSNNNLNDLRGIIASNDTVVIMKVAKRFREVVDLLREMNLLSYTIFGSHVGMEGERLINGMNEPLIASEEEAYLSTIIVKKRKK